MAEWGDGIKLAWKDGILVATEEVVKRFNILGNVVDKHGEEVGKTLSRQGKRAVHKAGKLMETLGVNEVVDLINEGVSAIDDAFSSIESDVEGFFNKLKI